MAEITDEQMRALHEAGVPLCRSWVTYAQPELKSRWNDLQSQSASDAFAKGVETAIELEGSIPTKIMHAFAEQQAIYGARNDLRNKLQANILSYIANGHLHGFGFEPPRRTVSVPVAIPKDAWAGKCDWEKGTLSFQGLEFVAVRLTTNRIRNEILERGVVDPTPTKSAGRPSVEKAIEAAFHALHQAGEIDLKASQSSHYPSVRAWLELNEPNLSRSAAQISEKTLYKYFSPLFNDLKKS